MPKNINVTDYSELYEFAIKNFNMSWNTCCDVFYNRHETIYSPENRNKKVYLQDCESELNWSNENKESKYYNENRVKTLEVLIAFMKEHNLEETIILHDK